jgi:hypothetical protein
LYAAMPPQTHTRIERFCRLFIILL